MNGQLQQCPETLMVLQWDGGACAPLLDGFLHQSVRVQDGWHGELVNVPGMEVEIADSVELPSNVFGDGVGDLNCGDFPMVVVEGYGVFAGCVNSDEGCAARVRVEDFAWLLEGRSHQQTRSAVLGGQNWGIGNVRNEESCSR